MNPEIKEQWLAALRSGDYQQGRKALRDEGKYCCLGVLCELAVQANIIPPGVPTHYESVNEETNEVERREYFTYGPTLEASWLPPQVVAWADINKFGTFPCDAVATIPNPNLSLLSDGDETVRVDNLANANDWGQSFEQIADMIEEYF